MVDAEIALSHDLFQISKAEAIPAACEKAVISPLAISMKALNLILRRYRKSLK
jgi:hypothetical protein